MSDDSRPLGAIVYQAFIIVLVIAGVVLGVSYYNSNQTTMTQASTIASLNVKLNTTTLENTKLKSDVTTLTTDKNTLQTQLSSLATETASLKSKIIQLTANVTSLQDEAQSLNTKLSASEKQVANLTAQNSELTSWASSLNGQIVTLQTQLSNQTSIVNMQRNLILESDKQITLAAGANTYLEYKTGFAGYIAAMFTSTSGVYFDMGSSQISDTWFGTYPKTGTSVTGTFKVPVMPGRSYLKITNPSATEAVIYLYLYYIY
jgi:predicted RNase H-like nuclease (RuvC/YqgF family)